MKTMIGTVISTKMEKTVVVQIERTFAHPRYGKVLRRRKKVKADVENLTINQGDVVRLASVAPISKDKHFKVLEVVKK